MQHNNFFKSEELLSLIEELSSKYNIDKIDANECVISSLSKAYGYKRVVVNPDGSITGLKQESKKEDFKLTHHNISKKIYKKFQEELSKEFYRKSFEKIENKFSNLVKNNNQIMYGRVQEYSEEEIVFKLFDTNGNQIKNFLAVVPNNKKFLFENEVNNNFYKQSEKGMLLYIPKREKIIQTNGIFKIKAVRRHEIIIRHHINTVFRKLKDILGVGYGYKKCFINLKEKKITIFLNLFFSPSAQEYFENKIKEVDNLNFVYVNAFKGSK